MDHCAKACRILTLASVVVFVSAAAPLPATAGAIQAALTVTKESRISVDVDNEPLNALLRMMAEQKLFVLSGAAPGNESLTLHFSNLTVPEALSKMLRGYNYVVIERGKGQAPTLSLMGRVQAAAPSRPAPGRRRPLLPPLRNREAMRRPSLPPRPKRPGRPKPDRPRRTLKRLRERRLRMRRQHRPDRPFPPLKAPIRRPWPERPPESS